MTRKSLFATMFRKSPIRPLQKHMGKVHECVSKLGPFFIEIMHENWDKAEELHKQIVLFENEADGIKRKLRLHLPKGLFMPVQRSDVLELLTRQDMIANDAKDIAGIVIGRKMIFPIEITQEYLDFLKRCLDATDQAYEAINELDKLFEVGFSGKEVKIVEDMVRKLHEAEYDADRQQIKLRKKLFELEAELPPVNVMFLYQILDWTGELADRAQRVGDSLQMLIAQ